MIAGVDVEGHDRNAGLDGLCDHRLDRLGEPVVDDDRVGLAVDRLLEVQRMPVVVAVGTQEVERDPELFGLGLGTGAPLLEVVAGRQLGDEGDVDAAVGELRRDLGCGGRARRRAVGRCGIGVGAPCRPADRLVAGAKPACACDQAARTPSASGAGEPATELAR